ncbi:hypothetical protein BCR42DRAFT_427187 [Absidia repens]|uniref:Uncharacterized protein n=1 Tax=Absidia repens TaxID=90262 RepID=A0A1X2I086_9FUNG|nr:hypothetical protein BCR42DRAFT_427187 [Absidia repens]
MTTMIQGPFLLDKTSHQKETIIFPVPARVLYHMFHSKSRNAYKVDRCSSTRRMDIKSMDVQAFAKRFVFSKCLYRCILLTAFGAIHHIVFRWL